MTTGLDPLTRTAGDGYTVIANKFGGADIGAQINAADASLGANPGTIHAYGGGNLDTMVVINPGHSLWLHEGSYVCGVRTVNGESPNIALSNNTQLRGDTGTIITEPGGAVAGLDVVRVVGLLGILDPGEDTAWGTNKGVTTNVRISDLRIIGRNDRTIHNGGTNSAIELGNGHNIWVERISLFETSDLGITAGGSALPNHYIISSGGGIVSGTNTVTYPAGSFDTMEEGDFIRIASAGTISGDSYVGRILGRPGSTSSVLIPVIDASALSTKVNVALYRGNHAEDVWVSDCKLERVESQGINCVNGRGIHFINNVFRNQGKGFVGCSSIDCEPNGPWDWMKEIFIEGNLIDGRSSKDSTGAAFASGNGIICQNANVTPNFGPIHITNNTIVGGDYRIGVTRLIVNGIQAVGDDIHVSGNTAKMCGQAGIACYSGKYMHVHDNNIFNCGTGGVPGVYIEDVTDSDFHDNRNIQNADADATNEDVMVEAGTSDRNSFRNNKTRARPTLVGANSKVHSWIDLNNELHIDTGAQVTSTLVTGTAPLVIASTTKVANLNVDLLDGGDWTAPGAIGGTTPGAGTFTTLTANTSLVVNAGTALTKVLKGTVTIDPASIAATTVDAQTFTLTGAVVGDSLVLNAPAAGVDAGIVVGQAFISAADTVKIVFHNTTAGAIDIGSASWTYTLIRS